MQRRYLWLALLIGCAPALDPDRQDADPGTFGHHVVDLLRKRLAWEATPTDVSGALDRDTCHGGDARADAPVTLIALVGDRPRTATAIDTAVAPATTDALQAYLTSDAVLGLYDDDTMSTSIQSLGDMLSELGDDPDAMAALARFGSRVGDRRQAAAGRGPGGRDRHAAVHRSPRRSRGRAGRSRSAVCRYRPRRASRHRRARPLRRCRGQRPRGRTAVRGRGRYRRPRCEWLVDGCNVRVPRSRPDDRRCARTRCEDASRSEHRHRARPGPRRFAVARRSQRADPYVRRRIDTRVHRLRHEQRAAPRHRVRVHTAA